MPTENSLDTRLVHRKSRRFRALMIATVCCMVLAVLCAPLFPVAPQLVAIAQVIGMITSAYLAGDSYRPSGTRR